MSASHDFVLFARVDGDDAEERALAEKLQHGLMSHSGARTCHVVAASLCNDATVRGMVNTFIGWTKGGTTEGILNALRLIEFHMPEQVVICVSEEGDTPKICRLYSSRGGVVWLTVLDLETEL